MLKILLVLTAIIVIAAAGYTWLSSSSSLIPVEPVTEATANAIKMKVQSGVTLNIASLRNRMQQTMAAPEKSMIDAITKESADLHAQVEETQRQLTVLGETEQDIQHWLNLVQWPQFLTAEQQFTKFVQSQQ